MREIHERFGKAMQGAIFQIVKDEAITEDIWQDCLVKIWKKGKQYNPAKGRLFTWLLNVCRNTALDQVRTKRFQISQQTRKEGAGTETVDQQLSTETKTDHIGLQSIINQLDPKHKQLIDLVYFGGRTQQEASDELNLPLGTVKTRLRKAIGQLKQWANR